MVPGLFLYPSVVLFEPSSVQAFEPPRVIASWPSSGCVRSFLLFRQREENGHGASPPLGVSNLDVAPVVPHDPMADGEAESGPFRLGGKEGIEEVLAGLRGETRTLVDHLDHRHRETEASG